MARGKRVSKSGKIFWIYYFEINKLIILISVDFHPRTFCPGTFRPRPLRPCLLSRIYENILLTVSAVMHVFLWTKIPSAKRIHYSWIKACVFTTSLSSLEILDGWSFDFIEAGGQVCLLFTLWKLLNFLSDLICLSLNQSCSSNVYAFLKSYYLAPILCWDQKLVFTVLTIHLIFWILKWFKKEMPFLFI